MLTNTCYPRENRHRTSVVKKCDIIIVKFTKDKGHENVNVLVYHICHWEEHRTNRRPNPGTPTNVNTYIDDFKAGGMTEEERYAIMEDGVTGFKKNFRQRGWKSCWAGIGEHGKLTLAVQLEDTRKV